jgi:hypothetical protein
MAPGRGRPVKREATISITGYPTPNESMSSSTGTLTPKREQPDFDLESVSDSFYQDLRYPSTSFRSHSSFPTEEIERYQSAFPAEEAEQQRRSASGNVFESFN